MNSNNNPIWGDILNRFPDQSNGEISPEDIRAFVNAVQKYKEDQNHHEEKLQDIWSNPYVYRDDLIIINNYNTLDPDYQYNGIYISRVDHPSSLNDLWLVTKGIQKSDDTPDEFKPISNDTQAALDLKFDKTGGNISGSITISDKLTLAYDDVYRKAYFVLKDDSGNNINFLIVDNDGTISGHGNTPNNPEDFTPKQYVDNLITDNLSLKENDLGNPTSNNKYLTSDPFGNRSWNSVLTEWGNITGDITNQGDLTSILSTKWDGTNDLTVSEDVGLVWVNNRLKRNLFSYSKVYGNVEKANIHIGDIADEINISATFSNSIILDRNVSIKGVSNDNRKSLIRRTDLISNAGSPSYYSADVLVGDTDVKTALYASGDSYEPVVRKGPLGNTIDYKIYTTEDFHVSDFANRIHIHSIQDVENLEDILNIKSDINHTHTIQNIDGLENILQYKSNINHTHIISDVQDLQQTLDNKSDITHRHSIDDIQDLEDTLDTKWDGKENLVLDENIGLIDKNHNYLFNYKITGDETGNFFDFKSHLFVGFDNCILSLRGTINNPIVLKNETSIQSWDSDYNSKVNLISRTIKNTSAGYNNDVVVGDSNVKTVLRSENDTLNPAVRKGTYGSTTDYMIYTEEHFDYRDIASLNHNHDITEVNGLLPILNNKLNKSGDTMSGDLKLDSRLILKSLGTVIRFDNIPDNGIVSIDNSSGDNIIDIWRHSVQDYDFKFYGHIQAENAVEDYQVVTKGYVDNIFQNKLDTHGGTLSGQLVVNDNIHCDNLYSRNEVTTRSIVSTGINANNNSAIQFNYMNGLSGVLFYDNSENIVENRFKLDVTTNEEEYVIYHSGNLDTSMYLDTRNDAIIGGDLVLDDGSTNGPSFTIIRQSEFSRITYNSLILKNQITEFNIENSGTEVNFKINSSSPLILKENESPTISVEPTKSMQIANKGYVDNNFILKTGGEIDYLSTIGLLNIGTEPGTDFSSIIFNYGKVNNPKFYFDNTANDFMFEIQNAAQAIYHTGNLNINDYLNKTRDNTVQGNIKLNNSNNTNPAFFESHKGSSEFSQLKYNSIFIQSGSNDVEIINENSLLSFNINGNTVLSMSDLNAPETSYSPSTDNSITNKKYVDDNFISTNGGEIQGTIDITESLNIGIDGNNNSTIRFNYTNVGGPGNASIYFDNNNNDFRINVTASEGYTLYHSGNLDVSNFLDVTQSSMIKGSLSLDTQDISAPASLIINNGAKYISLKDTGISFENNTSGNILLTDTNELQFYINNTKIMELSENISSIFVDPTSDNHIVNKKYVDDNFMKLTGDVINGDITLDSTGTTFSRLIFKSNELTNDNNGIAFSRPDGTYRFEIFSNIDETEANFVLYDTDGSTYTNNTKLINDGNIRVLDTTSPNDDYDLVTKKYVDDNLVNKADNPYVETRLDEKLDIIGGTIKGSIQVGDGTSGGNISITATSSTEATIFLKNNSNIVKSSLQLNSTTEELEITGDTRFSNAPKSNTSPVEAEDLTNKDYVDNVVLAVRNEVESQDVDYTKVFDYSQNTGTNLSRAELEDICNESLGSIPNNNIAFIVCTADDHWFIVRYIQSHDKFLYKKLTAR